MEAAKLEHPDDPSQYRRVNKVMDKELIWYKTEIEKRFAQSTCKDYELPRTLRKMDMHLSHNGIYDSRVMPTDSHISSEPTEDRFSFYKTSIRTESRVSKGSLSKNDYGKPSVPVVIQKLPDVLITQKVTS